MKKVIIFSVAVFIGVSMTGQTSLSLQECREMALQNDNDVRNARLDVLAASAQKQEAFAEYFPRVSLNSFGFMAADPLLEVGVKDILGESIFSSNVQAAVDYLGSRYGFPSVYTALQSGFSASVSVLQPVYAGGRIVIGNRLASLGKEAAFLQNGLTVRETLENIDKDYWKVVVLEEKIATLEASMAFLDNLYNDVQAALSAGLALDTDLLQVQLKKQELRKLMLSLTGGVRLAKMKLFNSIGQQYSLVPGASVPYIDDISVSDRLSELGPPSDYHVPEEEMASGLTETKLLDMSVEQKRLERKMAMGEALPQVGIGASYGYAHAINNRFNGIVFATVRIPLSDWGKISRRMQRLDFAVQKARNDREYLGGQLLLQVRSLWMDLTVRWEEVALARENVTLAQVAADRMYDRYEAGLVTLSDLLQSRMQLRITSDACVEAMAGYASALAAYLLRQ